MTLERVRRGQGAPGARASTCPVIIVAGTNGKGSTCAMLEAIALQAGYRVGLYIKPHLVHFEERCRINGAMVDGADAAAALRGGRGGARRRQPDLLRVHDAGHRCACSPATPLDLVDPRSRPGRAARRGQRRSTPTAPSSPASTSTTSSTSAPTARRSAARRPASCAPAGRRSSATRCRRRACSTQAARDRRRPVAASAATSTTRATSSSGPGPGAAQRYNALGLSGAARRQPAAQRLGRAGGARSAARAAADQRAGGAHRPGAGRTAGPLPDRARASRRWCSTSRTTRTRSRRWRRTSTRWASIPRTHAVFGAMRDKDLAGDPGADGAARRPLVLHRPADAARRQRRELAEALAQLAAKGPRTGGAARHADPPAALPRPSAARTPLIESSSSARSTPWAAC